MIPAVELRSLYKRYSVLDVADSSPWWSLFVSVSAAVLFTWVGSVLFARGYRIKD